MLGFFSFLFFCSSTLSTSIKQIIMNNNKKCIERFQKILICQIIIVVVVVLLLLSEVTKIISWIQFSFFHCRSKIILVFLFWKQIHTHCFPSQTSNILFCAFFFLFPYFQMLSLIFFFVVCDNVWYLWIIFILRLLERFFSHFFISTSRVKFHNSNKQFTYLMVRCFDGTSKNSLKFFF